MPGTFGDLGDSVPAYVAPETSAKITGPIKYNQIVQWQRVIKEAQNLREGDHSMYMIGSDASFTSGTTVVHMVFDHTVCPAGGLMNSLISSLSVSQPPQRPRLSPKELQAMGYLVDDTGKVTLVDDIPVGQVYFSLMYWAGGKQFNRWHMEKPIQLDPARKGDPCFMDDNMVAFLAWWKDPERISQSLHALQDQLEKDGVGKPRLIDLCWVE